MRAFVVRAVYEGVRVEGVHDQLAAGHARIGWSGLDSQDLRVIQRNLEKERGLDEDKEDARRRLRFLTEAGAGDLLLCPRTLSWYLSELAVRDRCRRGGRHTRQRVL